MDKPLSISGLEKYQQRIKKREQTQLKGEKKALCSVISIFAESYR